MLHPRTKSETPLNHHTNNQIPSISTAAYPIFPHSNQVLKEAENIKNIVMRVMEMKSQITSRISHPTLARKSHWTRECLWYVYHTETLQNHQAPRSRIKESTQEFYVLRSEEGVDSGQGMVWRFRLLISEINLKVDFCTWRTRSSGSGILGVMQSKEAR